MRGGEGAAGGLEEEGDDVTGDEEPDEEGGVEVGEGAREVVDSGGEEEEGVSFEWGLVGIREGAAYVLVRST